MEIDTFPSHGRIHSRSQADSIGITISFGVLEIDLIQPELNELKRISLKIHPILIITFFSYDAFVSNALSNARRQFNIRFETCRFLRFK